MCRRGMCLGGSGAAVFGLYLVLAVSGRRQRVDFLVA